MGHLLQPAEMAMRVEVVECVWVGGRGHFSLVAHAPCDT